MMTGGGKKRGQQPTHVGREGWAEKGVRGGNGQTDVTEGGRLDE